MQRLFTAAFALTLMSLYAFSTLAQIPDPQKCRGPIYSRKEVTKPAKMIDQPNFKALYEAFGNDVSGQVKLEAIFCRSGRITDIQVIDSQPPKIGEFVAAALSLVSFKPAELNWHTVSQRQEFEFSINQSGVSEIDAAAAAGRLIEHVDIVGNRRITRNQILSWIKTRPGEPYNSDQIKRDLEAILATGVFDRSATRVYAEEGARSGVGVIFRVVELALIGEVKFEGLKIDQSVVLKALEKEQINLRTGVPFNFEQMKAALRIIKQVLESNGQSSSKVDLQIEHVTATTIKVIFVITNE
jgi:hypothetical protein